MGEVIISMTRAAIACQKRKKSFAFASFASRHVRALTAGRPTLTSQLKTIWNSKAWADGVSLGEINGSK